MPIRRDAAIVVLTGVLVACADDATAPKSPLRPSLSIDVPQGGSTIIHAPIRQRFGEITITSRTPIRLGVPVVIEVGADVIMPSNSVHLKVQFPEVSEIAFRHKYGANRPGPRSAAPQFAWNGASRRGALKLATRVVFPVPGLYRVSAYLQTDDPSLDDHGDIQNTTGKVAWVYATASGGRVISSFADLVKDKEASSARTPVDTYVSDPQAAIGITAFLIPVCDVDPSSCDPCTLDPYSCQPPPGPQPGTFTGSLLYDNRRLGQTVPLANATMYIFEERVGGWSSSSVTDAGGRFTLQCPAASLRGHVQLVAIATNPYADVMDANQSPESARDLSYYRPQAEAAIDRCGIDTGPYPVAKSAEAELFDNITQTAQKSRITFPGFSRGKIMVNWTTGTDTVSSYSPSTDRIAIHQTRSVGEFGLFEAAHEYGHALHHAALGGITLSDANANECQTHDRALPTNFQCAFVEGFGHYHALALWGTLVGVDRFISFDQDAVQTFPAGSPPGDPLGPQTEGAVAATMLHVGDPTGSRMVAPPLFAPKSYNDGIAGHGQIPSAIRDCRVTLADGSVVKADGVDYLVYCLEKYVEVIVPPKQCNIFKICTQPPAFFSPRVEPQARDIAFLGLRSIHVPGRTIGPPNAVSWSWGPVPTRGGLDSNMRIIWRCNLFYCA